MKKQLSILLLSAIALAGGCSHGYKDHQKMSRCSDPKWETPAYFEFDSAVLSIKDKHHLKKIAHKLHKNLDDKITVKGYTDATGPYAYNMELSKHRAKAAADYLESLGVSPDRITVQGFGATDFAMPNTTAADRAKNRRVVVVFH